MKGITFPNFCVFVLILAVLSVSPTKAQNSQFTPEFFRQFTEMRAGTGKPIYWYCVGEIYEYPGGKLIAKVERNRHGADD